MKWSTIYTLSGSGFVWWKFTQAEIFPIFLIVCHKIVSSSFFLHLYFEMLVICNFSHLLNLVKTSSRRQGNVQKMKIIRYLFISFTGLYNALHYLLSSLSGKLIKQLTTFWTNSNPILCSHSRPKQFCQKHSHNIVLG